MRNFMFQEFCADNLCKDISGVVEFSDEEKDNLACDIQKYIIPRLNIFIRSNTIYYIFENEYVETEWKDTISVHYINTSYRTKGTVMRVHLFSDAEVLEDKYLGFFTLRNINDVELMLSYVYPNWKNMYTYFSEKSYLMTYKKRVHIHGSELNMCTYPLYVQDSAVTSCSHASMISMSKYLKGKYNYQNIRIYNINNSYTYGRKKIYPTLGLDPLQMLEILDTNGICVDYKTYSDKMQNAVRAHIDFCIESAMPVLLGIHITNGNEIAEHVVQIVGHTLTEEGEKNYIIYDDSGYYFAQRDHSENSVASFVGIITWKDIKMLLSEDENHECGFIMYPLHERIYILYDELRRRHFKTFFDCIGVTEDGIQNKVRILIVDNNLVKKYLHNLLKKEKVNCDATEDDIQYEETVEKEIKRLINRNLPHYIWVLEVNNGTGKLSLVLADPTLNSTTRKSILLASEAFTVSEGFALLNDFS